MSKCLYCYQELEKGQVDFHPSCARKFFGSETVPILPYTRDNMSELARQVIRTSASVTGVQAKMSLDVQRFWEVVLFSWITGNSDMHCKNFSLIDSGNGEYVLSPAYDLLAVLLADPQDTEEMAMAFSVGGNKNGFDRNTFMTAFTQSGIPVTVAYKMIERIKSFMPKWEVLIDESFLPDKMKADYHLLLSKRIEML